MSSNYANAPSDPRELLDWLNANAADLQESDDDIPTDSKGIFEYLNAGNPNLPIPSFPSLEEVTEEATKRVSNIFRDWDMLNATLLQHEDVLRRRWAKKNHEQRKKVLLSAWPKMAATHRPDFQALRREPTSTLRANLTKFRDEYVFPFINLEDLQRGNNLPLFLNSRGHHNPDTFAYFDTQMHHLGLTSTAIQPSYISGYTMFLSGRSSPQTYGEVVSWDDDSDAFSLMTLGIGIQPGGGLLLLEIQERILAFLLRCTELILHDLLPIKPSPSSNQLPLSPPIVSVAQDDAEWPTVSAIVTQIPYGVPVQFDFGRVKSLVAAKLAEAEDHVWLLREDPGYFRGVVDAWADHQLEQLQDANRRPHTDLGKPEFWNKVLGSVVVDAYKSLITWDLLDKHIVNLTTIREKYAHDIRPDKRLPDEYASALDYFSFIVDKLRSGPLYNFRNGIFASPPLRRRYVRRNNSTIVRRDSHHEDYFLWLIERFLDDHQIMLVGLSEILDELERLTRTKTNVGGSPHVDELSPWIRAALSDLAVLSELDRQLRWHQPIFLASGDLDEMKKLWANQSTHLKALEHHGAQLLLEEFGTPLGKFEYPSDKRRTANSTKKMRDAEQNLDAFWAAVDDHYESEAGKSLHQLLPGLISTRELQRTPEWVEPPSKTVSEITTAEPLSQFLVANQIPSTEPRAQVKTKVKTRGVPNKSTEETYLPEHSVTIPSKVVGVSVDTRAYKLFSSLFHNPNLNAQSSVGEIRWSEFLRAFGSIGFAVQKQYGSAWLFTPVDIPLTRPIIFHEPHPATNIPIHIARRHGRRLTLAYGWTADTFILE